MKRIRLTSGRYTIVDDCDFELLSGLTWGEHIEGYASHKETEGKSVMMHRLILGAPKGKDVDHINRNRLDNRRSNLRLCTKAENQMNRPKPNTANPTSKFKGVFWRSQNKKWQASVSRNKKVIYLGLFDSQEEAARAYDKAVRRMFGPFAYTNYGKV